MTEQAQVGDTVRLTITVEGVIGKWQGEEHVMGYTLVGIDRTVEILSRATPPLPDVPFTYWLDGQANVWFVDYKCVLVCISRPNLINSAKNFAPFRQLVLK